MQINQVNFPHVIQNDSWVSWGQPHDPIGEKRDDTLIAVVMPSEPQDLCTEIAFLIL